MPEVVELLQDLFGGNPAQNVSYFQWKHHDNPHANDGLGVVATHNGVVVGFRGYFATCWYVGSKDNRMIVLLPGDTVVHPEHRRKNLSVAMGKFAMERYGDKYRVFLNMSAGESSVPGYLRMGFAPLGNKAYYSRRSWVGDAKFIYRKALKKQKPAGDIPLNESRISFGSFGDILVSKDSRPEDMARLSSIQTELPTKISLLQDEDFFRWRFQNPKRKYAFYFYRRADVVMGYLVMLVSEDTEQGSIVDYGQDGDGPIGRILDHIFEKGEYDKVNILSVGVDDRLWRTLKSRKFTKWGLQRRVQKLTGGEWPVLVRPVKREYGVDDWFLEGLDIRELESWRLKPICGDGA